MKLQGRYRLLVKGDIGKITRPHAAIAYLFGRLLNGERAEMWGLHNIGIEVRELDDSDEIISVPESG